MSVYFAQAGRYMKIGYSSNPIARADTVTLLGKRPDDLPRGTETTLLGWVPGDTRREIEMHVRFASQRVEGEWFVLDETEVRELIWADPAGVDVQRMTAWAVFAAFNHPGITRAELVAAGVPLMAVSVAEVFGLPDWPLKTEAS